MPPGTPCAADKHQRITRLYLTWYHDWYTYKRKRLSDQTGWFNPLAYSGSTWGRVIEDDGDNEGGSISFFVNEGIDWFELPGGFTFNTYVEPRFSYRTKNYNYFNTITPAIGVELQRPPFHIGTDYYWDYYYSRAAGQSAWVPTWRLYLTWYYNWDLKNAANAFDRQH